MNHQTSPSILAGATRAALCLAFAVSAQALADTTSTVDHTWDFTRSESVSPNWVNLGTTANPAIADSFYRFAQIGGSAMVGWTQDRNIGNGGGLYVTGRTDDPLTTYIARTLNDGSFLATNQSLTDFAVSITNWWQWGSGNHTSSEKTYLGLLNADGNGYLAEIVRSGTAILYSISGGLTDGTWTELGTTTFDRSGFGSSTDNKQILLSLTGGTLTLSQKKEDGTGDAIGELSTSVVSTAYGNFTTLIIGAGFGSNDNARFDNVHLSGTISAIPEPKAFAWLAGGFVLVVLVFSKGMRFRR